MVPDRARFLQSASLQAALDCALASTHSVAPADADAAGLDSVVTVPAGPMVEPPDQVRWQAEVAAFLAADHAV